MAERAEAPEPVVHEAAAAIRATSNVTAELTVRRGLNGIRLAVLGILAGIGLTVGFGTPGQWWVRVLAGLGSFVAACALIRLEPAQRRVMAFMHWLTAE